MMITISLVSLVWVGVAYVLGGESFFIIWLGAELVSLVVMMLVISGGNGMTQGGLVVRKMNTMMKYMLVQMTMGGVLLMLIMVKEFGSVFTSSGGSVYLSLGLIVILSVKMGVFPGHTWVVDVFSGLSLFECFLIGVLPKFGLYVLLFNFFDFSHEGLCYVVLSVGFLSVLVGGVLGCSYSDVRCVMGCSSIVGGGWLMIGLGGCYYWMFLLGFSYYIIVVFVLLEYLTGALGVFEVFGPAQLGGTSGVRGQLGVESGVLNLLLLGFVGVPCSLVFFFKLIMVVSGAVVGPWLVVCTMIGGVVSVVMYQRIASVSWMCDSGGSVVWVCSDGNSARLGGFALVFSVLFLFLNFVLFFYYM
uniref:NADH-ubiquinone oxidoreductase chain 2 n=1 Tax=Ascidiella aspersa TaxID=201961 RepID=S0DF51_9ASCI|nr:NADH dehydrogenase subunit 2 [Ascidiella aspersa]CCO25815.1 NADH dehydrogenase subunit 2 [Ascidiella aspersa]